MSEALYFEAGPETLEMVRHLQRRFGDPTPEQAISRALRAMTALSPFVKDDILTVVDPDAETPNEPLLDKLVSFRFEPGAAGL